LRVKHDDRNQPRFQAADRAQRAAFKAYLIQKYCEERADEQIVAAAFELFPELAEA